MCAHMMSGPVYSSFSAIPLDFLSLLFGLALLGTIVFFTYWSRRGMTLRKRDEPQPHEEPYLYATPRETGLEMLREHYTRGKIEP